MDILSYGEMKMEKEEGGTSMGFESRLVQPLPPIENPMQLFWTCD